MKSPSRTERSDSELRICASSSNPKPISGEAPRGPHVADYGQKKKAPKKTLGIPLGPAGAPCPANEPLAPLTSPSQPQPQRPLLAPLEALGWLLPWAPRGLQLSWRVSQLFCRVPLLMEILILHKCLSPPLTTSRFCNAPRPRWAHAARRPRHLLGSGLHPAAFPHLVIKS